MLDKLENSVEAWKGSNYDSGKRKSEVQLLSSVDDLTSLDRVLYVLVMAEDDGSLLSTIVGTVIIVAVAAILTYFSFATVLAAVGGAAIVTAAWVAIADRLGEDDVIGVSSFSATSLNMDERIALTHAPDFLTQTSPPFGALPAVESGPTEGEVPPRLIHPFVDFSLKQEPLSSECNPGACSTGKTCQVNRCVDSGFVDPTAGVGFKERREFNGDGRYAVDILWESAKTPP